MFIASDDQERYLGLITIVPVQRYLTIKLAIVSVHLHSRVLSKIKHFKFVLIFNAANK